MKAVVVNAGCANAVTGAAGAAAARRVQERAAEPRGLPARGGLRRLDGRHRRRPPGREDPSLPPRRLRAALRRRPRGGLARDPDDRRRRRRSPGRRSVTGTGACRVVGVAKGAGMIHPNMATMLAFVTTDAPASPALLSAALKEAVDAELQRDLRRRRHLDERHRPPPRLGRGGRTASCGRRTRPRPSARRSRRSAASSPGGSCGTARERRASWRSPSTGRRRSADAKAAAHAVATSPLVKTALYGGDPNWGRILAAIGRSGARVSTRRVSLRVGRLVLVKDGAPTTYREAEAAKAFSRERVPLVADLGVGNARARLLAADLGHEYVSENADYRS